MTASPDVTSRMDAMRERLEKSKVNAAEGMARFAAAAIESPVGNNITLPSSSLRAMLARVKMGQEKAAISQFIGIDTSKIPQTV